MNYIDIHSHLNLSELYPRRDEVILQMKSHGVSTITVGTGMQTSRRALEIARQNSWWATVGIHPLHVDEESFSEWISVCDELVSDPTVVAIGECGFDYYYQDKNKELQEQFFRSQIELAMRTEKPLMIHARPHRGSMDAYHDVLDMLMEYGEAGPYAHFHFFSGDVETAKRIIDAGYSISVDGPITFTREYDDMIRSVPLTRIMCETDSPYAAPIPYRGTTAEPWMVIEVYKQLAEIYGLPLDYVRQQCNDNAKRIFGI
jgi:TatD DNase family protein